MKFAHNIRVSVFSKPEDSEAKVKEALASIFPFDLDKEKVKINGHSAVGFNERKIRIFEIILEKNRLIRQFMENLKKKLGVQCRKIADQAESRIDEEMHLFIRLDKEALIKEKKYRLTDGGNCLHIKISPAVYPKRRKRVIELTKGFFNSLSSWG